MKVVALQFGDKAASLQGDGITDDKIIVSNFVNKCCSPSASNHG